MVKVSRLRWAILLSVAVATAIASFYPTDENALLTVRGQKQTARASTTLGADPKTGMAPIDDTRAGDASEDMDPFVPRGWKAPPPPPASPKPAIVAVVPVAPPVPVGPPPLPFKFMGAMNDDGTQVIYLSKGDQAYVAHDGETLDSAYKVLAVDGQHVEFEYLPTGDKQTLTIPASDN